MKLKAVLLLSLSVLIASVALAGPAAWYEWRNSTTREIICSQILPGKGWVKYRGPYMDRKCTTLGHSKR
jgi:hypothetical protein